MRPAAAVTLPSRELWLRHDVRRAVAAALIASAVGCGREAVSPNSDELGVYVVGPGLGVFELDSLQYAASLSGGPRLKAGSVAWSVSKDGYATISTNGLVKAIRATDFDLPVDPSPSAQLTVNAKAGTHTGSMLLSIFGWKKPRAPDLNSVAYLEDEAAYTQVFPLTAIGVDQAGEAFGGAGSLILTCGTVVAGHWTVEINPEEPDYPPIAPTRKLYATDTVSVAFDGEVPRLQRWQPVGSRLRAPDGDDMVRQMLRSRRLSLTAQSYAVVDPLVKFRFRLGNVAQVTQAAIFRACPR